MDNNNAIDINNNNKKIDNRIMTDKEKINNIDDKLDAAKKRIKNLSNMQDNIDAIAKNMNKCIELLSKSIKGQNVNNRFNDMRNSNRSFLVKATANIEEETLATRKKINELYKEKDEILRQNRERYHQEEAKKEKELNNQEENKKE